MNAASRSFPRQETEREAVLRVASLPMAVMAASILDLRARGHHELADNLARVRDSWARAAGDAVRAL